MKNTMKMKSLLSFFVPAAMMSLMVAGCSDYDNGYDTNAIKFAQEFRKTFGDIDPEQDWNLAERGTVTVSTMKESEVKIYALRGNEYVLVGDYEGVKGTKMLGFDMVEGTNSIMVTDGVTAEKTVPGGVVAFGDTRTTHASEGYVKVHKLEGPVTLEDGKTYEKYRYNTETEYKKVTKETVEQGKVNLSRVINNFSYVSNGPFIIYPYYWYTSSTNTVGVYYYDNNGELQEVPIYTTKGNNDGEEPELISYELFYEDDGQVWDNSSEGYPSTPNWQTNNGVNPGGDNFKGNTFDTKSSESGMTQPFTEYWFPASQSQTLQPGQITRVFNNFTPGERYRVEIKARLWNGNKNGDPKGVKFFLNDANSNSVDLSANKTVTYYEETPLVYGTYSLEFVADENGAVTVGFDIADDRLGNWLTFKDLKIFHMKEKHEWTSTNGKEFFNGITRGQGIYVDIPKGTQFGMYLHSVNIAGEEITYYSQAELNTASPDGKPEDEMYGYGVKYKGSGVITDKANWEKDADLYPCYASTFNVDGQMFFGFEDWRNPTNGDMDLNDVVLAISGFDPTVINEDPTENSWLLVCEDLGGSFDTDYNDVIFKVDHVSGQPTAKVTAMAAGGTLASYIFFRDPTTQNAQDQVVGEIHQMFGVAPESSGEYAPINATTRYEKGGNTVSIDVGENWTLAYYQADQFHQGSVGNYGENVNMGGFQIRTLKSGTPDPGVNVNANTGVFNSSSTASVIAAPDKGAAPYILCLPYTYTKPVGNKLNTYVWAWPQELCTICSAVYYQNDKYSGSNGGAYLEFGEWVRDHSKNVEWYKNRNVNALTVEELLLKSEDIQQGGLQTLQLGNNGSITVKPGTEVNLFANLINYIDGTYTFTYSGEMGSGTITNPASWTPYNEGRRTITVTRAADNNYAEATTSFTFVVQTAPTVLATSSFAVYSNYNWFALEYVDGDLKMKYKGGQAQQVWEVQDAGGDDYVYLYNVGAKKYLSLDMNNSYKAIFVDTPNDWSKFVINDDGTIECYGKQQRYLGSNAIGAEQLVDGNASTPINWTQSDAQAYAKTRK